MRALLVDVDLQRLAGQLRGLGEPSLERRRGHELEQAAQLVRPLGVAHPGHVHGDERLAEDVHHRRDARRRDHDHARVDEELLLSRGEHRRGQDGLVRADLRLILAQLRHEGVLPRRARPAVDQDLSGRLPFVADVVDEVAARFPLRPRDLVLGERAAERVVEIDLAPFGDLAARPAHLPAHLHDLLLQGVALAGELRILL